MPELPEVEVTRRGIQPYLDQQTITRFVIHNPRLRWPVDPTLSKHLPGQTIREISRRGKYLLLGLDTGTLILHLGMSGHLRVVPAGAELRKHDHLQMIMGNDYSLHFNDQRRFGAFLWTTNPPQEHPLLANLGPEPLTPAFTGAYLHEAAQRHKQAIKAFLMDSHVVVGVGNIYATESLWNAGIAPHRPAREITRPRFDRLVAAVKTVLTAALQQGGSSIQSFLNSDGNPGKFHLQLQAYGRGGQPCPKCKRPLHHIRLNQRATVYCQRCQT